MRLVLAAAAALLVGLACPAQAEQTLGELRCMIAGGIGFGPVGKRATTCVYYRRDGRVEFYLGSFGRFGLDIGPTQARQAIFSVVAAIGPEPIGVLDGDFVGAGVGVSLGKGIGGDGLIGGRDRRVVIVPLANTHQLGLNVSAGIGDLHLRYMGTEGRRAKFRGAIPNDAE